jgi:NAD(P)-dependent dehydrogenase (short-subunit alcohol dehydrogenase family)
VTDHAGFTDALDHVESTLGPLDVLINNAGIMPLVAFEDETPEACARVIAVNLGATVHGTREASGG